MRSAVALLLLALHACAGVPALAHEVPGFSPEMKAWAANADITPEGKKWLWETHKKQWAKCCNHAEIVDARFIIRPNGADGWRWNDNGVVKDIPQEIIHPYGDHAPNGRATLFIYSGVPTCFFIPEGGI